MCGSMIFDFRIHRRLCTQLNAPNHCLLAWHWFQWCHWCHRLVTFGITNTMQHPPFGKEQIVSKCFFSLPVLTHDHSWTKKIRYTLMNTLLDRIPKLCNAYSAIICITCPADTRGSTVNPRINALRRISAHFQFEISASSNKRPLPLPLFCRRVYVMRQQRMYSFRRVV